MVGAGPAGLKAAEIAARRGYPVRILEAVRHTGGRLRQVERTAASALAGSFDHLVAKLGEAGVKVEPGMRVDEALLREIAPSFVVLATGATPAGEAFPGAGTGHVVDTGAALSADLRDPVLAYDTLDTLDTLDTNEPTLLAEALARAGRRVTFVTRYERSCPSAGWCTATRRRASDTAALDRIITAALLGDLDGGVVTVVRPDGETIAELKVGSVVAATLLGPAVELLAVLERLGIPHAVAGDTLAPASRSTPTARATRSRSGSTRSLTTYPNIVSFIL